MTDPTILALRVGGKGRGQPAIALNIGVLVQRGRDGWRIGHYQASRIG